MSFRYLLIISLFSMLTSDFAEAMDPPPKKFASFDPKSAVPRRRGRLPSIPPQPHVQTHSLSQNTTLYLVQPPQYPEYPGSVGGPFPPDALVAYPPPLGGAYGHLPYGYPQHPQYPGQYPQAPVGGYGHPPYGYLQHPVNMVPPPQTQAPHASSDVPSSSKDATKDADELRATLSQVLSALKSMQEEKAAKAKEEAAAKDKAEKAAKARAAKAKAEEVAKAKEEAAKAKAALRRAARAAKAGKVSQNVSLGGVEGGPGESLEPVNVDALSVLGSDWFLALLGSDGSGALPEIPGPAVLGMFSDAELDAFVGELPGDGSEALVETLGLETVFDVGESSVQPSQVPQAASGSYLRKRNQANRQEARLRGLNCIKDPGTTNPDGSVTCGSCGREYQNLTRFRARQYSLREKYVDKKFVSAEVLKKYKNKSYKEKDKGSYEDENGEEVLFCGSCGRIFSNSASRSAHLARCETRKTAMVALLAEAEEQEECEEEEPEEEREEDNG